MRYYLQALDTQNIKIRNNIDLWDVRSREVPIASSGTCYCVFLSERFLIPCCEELPKDDITPWVELGNINGTAALVRY